MKIGILDGYRKPRHHKRKRRSSRRRKSLRGLSPAMKRNQNKMKTCAVKWRKSGKRGSYRSFISKCLKHG